MDDNEIIKEFEGKRSELFDPVKLCCGKKMSEHTGPTCPDGLTMCCMCFERFAKENLSVDNEGNIWNVCTECAINEALQLFKQKDN